MSSRKGVGFLIGVLVIAAALAVLWVVKIERIPKNVAYVTEENGGLSIIDLNKLQVVRRIRPKDVAPRGIGITFDGEFVITADKDTADAAVFSTRRLHLVQRIPVGDNPEFVKFHPSGEWFFTSYEPGSTAGPPTEGARDEEEDENEPPAQIVQFNVPSWTRVRSFTAGMETEGLEFSRDGKYLIVANEAQNTIGVYDLDSGKSVRTLDLKPYGARPRGIKVSPDGNSYACTMEASGTLLKLDQKFNVIKTVATAAKPYGVAFDRSGQRIFVAAAAAKKLQIYSADSLQLIGETPVGQRCWHFTFTPDDSKLLLACGRSNAVFVVDAKTYQPIKVIGGFQMPWGIVTYPRSYGSLGLP
jgi:YVTN family beta-propeller protein